LNKTTISWTTKTWNPLRGCSRVSEGCRNCYAEALGTRFCRPGLAFDGFVAGGRWTGRVKLLEHKMHDPALRKPGLVFVNSTSDLFHENLPLGDTLRVLDAIRRNPIATFQALTKRAHRLRLIAPDAWPSNLWMGVSVESAAHLDRIDDLRGTNSAVKWVSFEPLLTSIGDVDLIGLDWIIIGGESGCSARPFHLEWARELIEQARAAGVCVFVKQMGAKPFLAGKPYPISDSHGSFMAEWPADLLIREWPASHQPAVRAA
jgi:protein gp37